MRNSLRACDAQITCCCFAPTKPHIIFAGTVDGGIQVWDTRELDSQQSNLYFLWTDTSNLTIRLPSYTTDGSFTQKRIHEDAIVSIEPLHTYNDSKKEKNLTKLSENDNVQIVSVDALGVCQVWVNLFEIC